jgi:hypothetical protein
MFKPRPRDAYYASNIVVGSAATYVHVALCSLLVTGVCSPVHQLIDSRYLHVS